MTNDFFGWSGKILCVDLSNSTTTQLNTMDYADRFLGGRGVATRIYWEQVPPAAAALFCRLKSKDNGTVKLPLLRKVSGSAQKHGHVTIMTAGVHHPVIDRAVHRLSNLLYGKGVHVGPQQNGPV